MISFDCLLGVPNYFYHLILRSPRYFSYLIFKIHFYIFHFDLLVSIFSDCELLQLNKQHTQIYLSWHLKRLSLLCINHYSVSWFVVFFFLFYTKLTSVVWLVYFWVNLEHKSAKRAEANCLPSGWCGLECLQVPSTSIHKTVICLLLLFRHGFRIFTQTRPECFI